MDPKKKKIAFNLNYNHYESFMRFKNYFLTLHYSRIEKDPLNCLADSDNGNVVAYDHQSG